MTNLDLKRIAFYIKPLLIDSDMKSLFSNRNKMIAISVINLLIVLYLGSIVWSLKNPTKKITSKEEKPPVPVESLVTQILGSLSTKERFEKIVQIPLSATLDQIKPLTVAWKIDWSGYQKSSELEKAQWLAQINGLYLKKEGGRIPMARAMASLLSTPDLPLFIRNRAYLDLCNAWVGADQQLQQATSDPKLAPSLPEREKELKELTIIVKVVTLALDRQGDRPLLPLRIQAKTYFTVHRPQEFNSKEWEAELIALQRKFPGDERIQIEVLKGLQALSSTQGIDRALQILNSPASSEALVKMAMSYLSNPPSPRGKEGLTKKRFLYPDLEEARLNSLEILVK